MAHLFGWQPEGLERLLPEELAAGLQYLEEVSDGAQ